MLGVEETLNFMALQSVPIFANQEKFYEGFYRYFYQTLY